MVWKKVVNSDPGDADHFGGDDTDKISDLFSGVDVDDVDINSDWTTRSGKRKLRNPANTFDYVEVASAIAANRNVTEPLLTGDDTRVYQAHTQTLTNKTLDRALNTLKLHDAFKYTIFIDTNDSNKIKCRDNDSGTIVSNHATDAKVPIQFAIDNASGKAIFIQRGIYNLASGLDLKEKYVNITGEKTTEYYESQGNTILKKNYSAGADDIFIDAFGATAFWYVDLRNLVIDGDNEGIGIKYHHNIRLVDNVFVRDFRTGIYCLQLVYANFNNLFVENCVDVGVHLNNCNTTYFYGGRINSAIRNVNIEDGNDIGFFGTSIEGGINYGVYLDSNASSIQPNAVHFYKCSFESNVGTLVELVRNEGSGVTFDGCRFDSSNTDYTLIHCTSTAKDMEVHACYFQANTASTTARIVLDASSARSRFLLNKKHQGGQITSFVFTDNGTDTMCLGNESITDKIPLSINFNGTTFYNAAATFANSMLKLRNVAGDFSYTIVPAAISADRNLNLPLITGTDTLATLGLGQTFTGNNTFSGTSILNTIKIGTNARVLIVDTNQTAERTFTAPDYNDILTSQYSTLSNPYISAGTSASVKRNAMWTGINDTNSEGFLSSGCTLVGTGSNFVDATEGGGRSFATGAVANNNAGLRWTTNRFRRDWGWYIILRCSFSSTSDLRVFIGTSDSSAEIAGETTLNNQSGVGVGKRTGDTNWFTYANDGDATEDRVDTGIAFATSAVTIQLACDSTSFRSKIGSTTNAAVTTELPATTNAGFLHVEIETGAGAADKTINIFPIWAKLGTVVEL